MLSEEEALQRLESGDFSYPPLELIRVTSRVDPRLEPDGGRRPDWLLVLAWRDAQEEFVVEYKSLSTPKRLREALSQARYLAEGSGLQPMIMTPYLDEKALDLLAREELSGLDFSGNGVVIVPGRWFVYRSGNPNAYPSSQYIQAIYSGRSSLVGRTLLLRQRFDTVSAVKAEIERREGRISLPTVSKVLKRLEEELIISRREGVALLQPDRLLDELVEAYESPSIRRRTSYRADDVYVVMRSLAEAAEAEGLRLAARGERMYTVFPGAERTLAVYTDDLRRLVRNLQLEEGRRFSNFEVLETREETVYFDRRSRDGFFWTSPVQAYLELAAGGKREREVAQQMRGELLAGEYA